MHKVQEFVVKGKEVFVGLEDSKKTWKLCVRSGRRVIHEASMPARYEVLHAYFQHKFPECKIHVMYEAGFSGFGLHDDLVRDGSGWAPFGKNRAFIYPHPHMSVVIVN